MESINKRRSMDVDLAKGLGLHMILIWGRVALVQGVPIVFKYNSILIILCSLLLLLYFSYVFFIKYKCIPKMNQGSIVVGVFVLVTLLFTVVVWPQNIQHLDPIGNTIFYEIIPFVVLSMLTSVESLYNPMVSSSKILLMLCAASSLGITLSGHTTVSSWTTYSMPLSYATLYAVMWLMSDYSHNRKKTTFILIVLGIIILLVFGSRNTLLSIASFVVVSVIKMRRNNSLIRITLLLVFTSLLLLWEQFLTLVNDIVHYFGLSSRTIDLFVSSNYFADDRVSIHNKIFNVLNTHPFGVGMAGDVAQTKEFAHGLYVSILCTYGYIIGSIVILAVLIVLIKAYKKSSGICRDVLVLYVLMVLPRGFTGGDIWSSDVFWWMVGIAIAIIYMKSNKQRYDTQTK